MTAEESTLVVGLGHRTISDDVERILRMTDKGVVVRWTLIAETTIERGRHIPDEDVPIRLPEVVAAALIVIHTIVVSTVTFKVGSGDRTEMTMTKVMMTVNHDVNDLFVVDDDLPPLDETEVGSMKAEIAIGDTTAVHQVLLVRPVAWIAIAGGETTGGR